MKSKKFALAVIFAVCVSLFTTGCNRSKTQFTRSVRIAIQPSAAFIPLYVSRYSGEMEKALAKMNVKVIWQDFESGPPMNESLQADLSDIGVIGDVPTVLSLAGATHMKLVGVAASGPNAYAMLARSDNKSLNSYRDLKGKRIATVFGSTGHNFTKKLLEKAGLTFDDVEFSNISVSDASLQLRAGTVDAVVIWEPNVTRLIESGEAKIIAQGEDTDLRGTNGIVVREEYLSDNKDIVKEVLNQYAHAVKELSTLDTETLTKLAFALNVTKEQVKTLVKKYDYTVGITQKDEEALQDTIHFLVSINNLTNEYRVENCVDKSCFSCSGQ